MKNKLIYEDGNTFTYASSIAATWIWTPAIFVAYNLAFIYGISGFLMFLIPNCLTLILFGIISYYVSNKTYFGDFIESPRQRILHLSISYILLICSTCVQLIGLNILLNNFFCIPKWINCISISLICLSYTFWGGLKACIISDKFKYIIMLLCAIILVGFNYDKISFTNFILFKDYSFSYMMDIFGITTIIGLLTAPYIDQTFWQRTFSIKKENKIKIFTYSSILFCLIPLMFGILGLNGTVPNLNISELNLISQILSFCTIFLALVATIDSNYCAVLSLASVNNIKQIFDKKITLCIVIIITNIFVIFSNISILDLFLIYGTIRTCMCIPTLLNIFKCYDEKRLFYSSIFSCIFFGIGYVICKYYAIHHIWILTLLAFLFPLFGLKFKNENI